MHMHIEIVRQKQEERIFIKMKTFIHQLTVTISDTNMQQTVYWTRFAEWFGQTRELFFLELMNNPNSETISQFLAFSHLSMESCDFHIEYKKQMRFGDRIEIRINTANFRAATVELLGSFVNLETKEEVAICRQTITFYDTNKKCLMKIPEPIRLPALDYQFPTVAAAAT